MGLDFSQVTVRGAVTFFFIESMNRYTAIFERTEDMQAECHDIPLCGMKYRFAKFVFAECHPAPQMR